MYSTVSAAKISFEDKLKSYHEIITAELANCLQDSKAVGNRHLRQLQKYAQIGLRITRSEHTFNSFMKTCLTSSKLFLVQVTSDVLVEMNDECFTLALRCVVMRLDHGCSGRFDQVRKRFFTCIKNKYDIVKNYSDHYNVSTKSILQTLVPVDRSNTVSIMKCIIQKC